MFHNFSSNALGARCTLKTDNIFYFIVFIVLNI